MNGSDFCLRAFGCSDIGLVRTNNEDIWDIIKKYAFFILADGMGGHRAGEIAAKEAVRSVCRSIHKLFSATTEKDLVDLSFHCKSSIENANSWVHFLGRERRECSGMGTTLCTLLFHKGFVICGHVGDSRVYRYRQGCLKQLTLDHSLINPLRYGGGVYLPPTHRCLCRKVLTRAVGTYERVRPDMRITSVNLHDVYLVCTDGLTDCVTDQQIMQVLQQHLSPEETTQLLIKLAKQRGGNDNITIITIQVNDRR